MINTCCVGIKESLVSAARWELLGTTPSGPIEETEAAIDALAPYSWIDNAGRDPPRTAIR